MPNPVLLGLLALTIVAASSAKENLRESREAPPDVVAWVKSHALPLTAVEAGNGFADLETLRPSLVDARIVALGEATHGSREVFQLKHRLVEFLATEMGFTLFAIEANMPEAQRLDAYVRGGEGDPAALIRGMYFWTWNTEEVLNLVEWMRGFNADPANRARGRQIGFTGFDMQTPDVAAGIARDFIAANAPHLRPQFDKAVAAIRRDDGPPKFGFANGSLPAEPVRGRRLTLSGWITTNELAGGWAGFWLRADSPNKPAAAFRNMQTTGPRGTTSWRRYEIAIDVPEDAESVAFGLLMPGQGRAWFDDLQFTLDGRPLNDSKILGLDFETDLHATFPSIATDGYRVELAPKPRSGKRSLQISSLPPAHAVVPPVQILEQWRACEAAIRALAPPPLQDGGAGQEWAAQNARIVVQSMENRLGLVRRDHAMATNVLWLAHRHPGEKIILWAHNGHVARGGKMMGGILSETLGDQLRVVGFATGRGTYRAIAADGSGRLPVLPLAEPPAGSVESVCDQTGLPAFVLDLRSSVRTGGNRAKWFDVDRPHRQIGSGELPPAKQFQPRRVGRDYDLLIWLATTTATVPLPAKP